MVRPSREGSKETLSDSAITQDILDNESEKPVWTTSEDIKSETADLYYIIRSRCSLRGPTWTMGDYFTSKQVSKYSLPPYLAD